MYNKAGDNSEEVRDSTQGSLCKVVCDLNMGPKSGRPKNKLGGIHNPFDFKLSTRVRNKLYCKKIEEKTF